VCGSLPRGVHNTYSTKSNVCGLFFSNTDVRQLDNCQVFFKEEPHLMLSHSTQCSAINGKKLERNKLYEWTFSLNWVLCSFSVERCLPDNFDARIFAKNFNCFEVNRGVTKTSCDVSVVKICLKHPTWIKIRNDFIYSEVCLLHLAEYVKALMIKTWKLLICSSEAQTHRCPAFVAKISRECS